MDPITLAAIIGGGAALVGGAASNIATGQLNAANRHWQDKVRDSQRAEYLADRAHSEELQRELIDDQRSYEDRIREYQAGREDTQYQRQVQDALKAGLNPAIIGGAANSAPTPITQAAPPQPASNAKSVPQNPSLGYDMSATNLIAELVANAPLKNSETERNTAAANKATQEAVTEQLTRLKKAGLIDAQSAAATADALNKQALAALNSQLKANASKEYEKIDSQIQSIKADTNLTNAQKDLVIKDLAIRAIQEEIELTKKSMVNYEERNKEITFWTKIITSGADSVARLVSSVGSVTTAVSLLKSISKSTGKSGDVGDVLRQLDDLTLPKTSGNKNYRSRRESGNILQGYYLDDNGPHYYD